MQQNITCVKCGLELYGERVRSYAICDCAKYVKGKLYRCSVVVSKSNQQYAHPECGNNKNSYKQLKHGESNKNGQCHLVENRYKV